MNGQVQLEFLSAAKSGDLVLAKALLNHFPFTLDLAMKVGTGTSRTTPLHVAIKNKRYEFVEYLLENNCDVNAKNGVGDTPLHVAVMLNCPRMVKLIMSDKQVNPCIPDREDKIPLHYAAIIGKKEIISVLTEFNSGEHLNFAAQGKCTPLMYAMAYGELEAITNLIQNPKVRLEIPDCSMNIITYIIESSCRRKPEVLKILLAQLVKKIGEQAVKEKMWKTIVYFRSCYVLSRSPLISVFMSTSPSSKSRYQMMHTLIRYGCPVDDIGTLASPLKISPLEAAVRDRDIEAVRILLGAGCAPPDSQVFLMALRRGPPKMIDLFMAAGVKKETMEEALNAATPHEKKILKDVRSKSRSLAFWCRRAWRSGEESSKTGWNLGKLNIPESIKIYLQYFDNDSYNSNRRVKA